MDNNIVLTYKDLASSGKLVQFLFASNFPNGLTIQQMLCSKEGWVTMAAKAYLKEHQANE